MNNDADTATIRAAALSADDPSLQDRRLAALSHLGIPFFGFLLPLAMRFGVESEFVKRHARWALRFQIVYFLFHIAGLIAILAYQEPALSVSAIAIAFVLEVPQVVRAWTGRRPLLSNDSAS